jgi:putative ABC transport system permease protein
VLKNLLIFENLVVALDTLRARKARSALTVLGIVIGVTSVISVAAIIDGLNGFVKGRLTSVGSRLFIVTRVPFGTNPAHPPAKIRTRRYLQVEDATFLRDAFPAVAYATVFADRVNLGQGGSSAQNDIRYGKEQVQGFFLRGAEPDLIKAVPQFAVAHGRAITTDDLEHNRAVAIIGAGVADSLFPQFDPIGKSVRMNGRPYDVIGVFERDPGLFGGFGVDQFVVIPFSNFHKNYPEIREMLIAVSIREEYDVKLAQNDLEQAMRRRRRLSRDADNDFELIDPNFLASLWDQITGALILLTGVISSIGLLVGGIGVMNIMLISVTERTQEIGLRKAVGAKKFHIRAQFLFEAVVLSVSGGLIGILCGAIIAYTVRALIPSVPATLSVFWISTGVAISVGVGLFFGYYPATRAANLDPIICLRYE